VGAFAVSRWATNIDASLRSHCFPRPKFTRLSLDERSLRHPWLRWLGFGLTGGHDCDFCADCIVDCFSPISFQMGSQWFCVEVLVCKKPLRGPIVGCKQPRLACPSLSMSPIARPRAAQRLAKTLPASAETQRNYCLYFCQQQRFAIAHLGERFCSTVSITLPRPAKRSFVPAVGIVINTLTPHPSAGMSCFPDGVLAGYKTVSSPLFFEKGNL